MIENLQLENRAILEISGHDRKKFLQGLITNDVNKATEKNLIYTAMLNAQGRFLYEFFIFELAEKLILDCDSNRRDEIFKKLNFYKLRSKVEITKNDELAVFWNLKNKDFQDLQFVDPRNPEMGFRIYADNRPSQNKNIELCNTLTPALSPQGRGG